MSETATKVSKGNGRFAGRVIRAVAHATVAEFWARLQSEGWYSPSDLTSEPQVSDAHSAGPRASETEVKHLLRMHDELVKLLEHFEARAGQSKRQRRRLRLDLRLVSNLIVRVLDRLQELGVARMTFPDVVDFRLHEPVEITPTHTLADDGRVTAVYIHGFTNHGCVVRQSKVAVLKYVPKPESQPRKENQI
ncbi:MAG TPA: hypothetical protein PLJ47_07395 [Candidatus Hydrogenedentes bacterium]|nr:hypothetical protein [Candidatus Hydrogenedentota bacterium]HRK34405.1 hypothetical protein [Candidatus Hydrogenedentota bacterium]